MFIQCVKHMYNVKNTLKSAGVMGQKRHPVAECILSEMRSLTLEAGITQSEVGTILGVTQSSVSDLMNGRTKLSMEHFLRICDRLGIQAQDVFAKAEARASKSVPMSEEMKRLVFKSDLHLICYCASTRSMKPSELRVAGFDQKSVEAVFLELHKSGLLIGERGRYRQINLNFQFGEDVQSLGARSHHRAIQKSCERYSRMRSSGSFSTSKFNWCQIDRFTKSQIREVEAALWKLYERINVFQSQNISSGYQTEKEMLLWNIHLMMMPGSDEPHV